MLAQLPHSAYNFKEPTNRSHPIMPIFIMSYALGSRDVCCTYHDCVGVIMCGTYKVLYIYVYTFHA